MLKLIIADDERIIRESISRIIDWSSLGIELIGVCQDGAEAYDMILDESPDIVLTDIMMPGLSGLELIEKVSRTDLDTRFILLSGYGEFNYAQQAMKYGVRHYLLKPCNEEQITECIQEVISECLHRQAFNETQAQQNQLLNQLYSNMITNLINEGVSSDSDCDMLYQPYRRFLDFDSTTYELCYLYYLEEGSLENCLQQLKEYQNRFLPGIPFHGIYVHNTLIIFFKNCLTCYDDFDGFMRKLVFPIQTVEHTYQRMSYERLSDLLTEILGKVKRYGTISCIHNFHPIPTCNYKNLISRTRFLSMQIMEKGPARSEDSISELYGILEKVTNPEFLKQLAFGIYICFSSGGTLCSPITATEFLLELNRQEHLSDIYHTIRTRISHFLKELSAEPAPYCDVIEKIIEYVNDNLSDPNLTLKWIAQNYLYMNVDYLSKKFIRETGMKFSDYLGSQRVEKAKELLVSCDTEKIELAAEKVGFGNNPQYFRQIFKRYTGMIPSAYVKKMGKKSTDLS